MNDWPLRETKRWAMGLLNVVHTVAGYSGDASDDYSYNEASFLHIVDLHFCGKIEMWWLNDGFTYKMNVGDFQLINQTSLQFKSDSIVSFISLLYEKCS